ncbi:hypothetical protein ACL02T_30195 [Pseudonocardia sp. RS010]|uniref:hypothetical protein n=1 Tax=Pseudonocardia sp. RS010 TaxID=3385979 RepID=UPI0039A0E75E
MSGPTLRSRFGSLSPAAKLLVVNQFGINTGFYMVLPFLTVYLATELGWATALVGLVLGIRVLSQQGLFLIGGTAADRLGCRPMIVLGCGCGSWPSGCSPWPPPRQGSSPRPC